MFRVNVIIGNKEVSFSFDNEKKAIEFQDNIKKTYPEAETKLLGHNR